MKVFPAVSFLAFAAAAAYAAPADWAAAKEISPGVRYREFSAEKPRPMKCYMVRVDLTRNFLLTTAKGTKRERTLEFARRLREAGTNVVVAVNTCPWDGGIGDDPASITNHMPNGMNVSNGEIVTARKVRGWLDGFFGVRTDGRVEIFDEPPVGRLGGYRILINGYAVVLKEGKAFNRRNDRNLHPRTAFGLSRDRRYLFLLAVDGRQKNWSHGADYADVAKFMLEAGAWDAANMDGGGSTTLVVFDGAAGKMKMVNRHDVLRMYSRAVSINLAVVPK